MPNTGHNPSPKEKTQTEDITSLETLLVITLPYLKGCRIAKARSTADAVSVHKLKQRIGIYYCAALAEGVRCIIYIV